MKEGSIVVVLKLPKLQGRIASLVKWLPTDDEKTPYMIRELRKDITGIVVARFEEGVIGYNNMNMELGIPIEYLRDTSSSGYSRGSRRNDASTFTQNSR